MRPFQCGPAIVFQPLGHAPAVEDARLVEALAHVLQRVIGIDEVATRPSLHDQVHRKRFLVDGQPFDEVLDVACNLVVDDRLFVAEDLLELADSANPSAAAQRGEEHVHHLLGCGLLIWRVRRDIQDGMVHHQVEAVILQQLLSQEGQQRLFWRAAGDVAGGEIELVGMVAEEDRRLGIDGFHDAEAGQPFGILDGDVGRRRDGRLHAADHVRTDANDLSEFDDPHGMVQQRLFPAQRAGREEAQAQHGILSQPIQPAVFDGGHLHHVVHAAIVIAVGE